MKLSILMTTVAFMTIPVSTQAQSLLDQLLQEDAAPAQMPALEPLQDLGPTSPSGGFSNEPTGYNTTIPSTPIPYQEPSFDEPQPFFEFEDSPSSTRSQEGVFDPSGPVAPIPQPDMTRPEDVPVLGARPLSELLGEPVVEEEVRDISHPTSFDPDLKSIMQENLSDHDPFVVGARDISDLLEEDINPVAVQSQFEDVPENSDTQEEPLPRDPSQPFSFREPGTPPDPSITQGALLSTNSETSVHVIFAQNISSNPGTWQAHSTGLPVSQIALDPNMGDITLALGSNEPVFWGVDAPKGTRITGVMLYGQASPYSSFAAKSDIKERANVIRRPDLTLQNVSQALIAGGASDISSTSDIENLSNTITLKN